MSGTGQILGNILSLGSAEVIARLVALVGTTYLARRLGPDGFGVVGFAAAVFGYLALPVSAGFNDVAAGEVSRRPDEAPRLAVRVIAVRLQLAVVAACALMGAALLGLGRSPAGNGVLLLSGLGFLPLALDTSWVYKGLEKNRFVGLALILGQALTVAFLLAGVRGSEHVLRVPLAQFLGDLTAALALTVPLLFRRGSAVRLPSREDLREGWRLARKSGLRTVSRLLRTLIFTCDVVLLGLWQGDRAVGLYSAAYRVCFALLAVGYAVSTAYQPSLIRAARSGAGTAGPDAVGKVVGRALVMSATLGAPLVVGGVFLAVPVLSLVFGNRFAAGAGALRLLLVSIGCIWLHATLRNVFLAFGQLRTETGIILTATLLNVGLNIALIPRFSLGGAAAATAAAEGLILALAVVAVRRLGVPINPRPLVRPAAAAVVMAGTLWYLGDFFPLPARLVVGAAAYALCLMAVGGLPDEVRLFRARRPKVEAPAHLT